MVDVARQRRWTTEDDTRGYAVGYRGTSMVDVVRQRRWCQERGKGYAVGYRGTSMVDVARQRRWTTDDDTSKTCEYFGAQYMQEYRSGSNMWTRGKCF